MKKPSVPVNESQRQQALDEYKVLDTLQEAIFDEITKTAALITGCKISAISLIDKDRQWFKSKVGLDATETPRDVSYCGHAILGNEIFVVEDSEKDTRFFDNPLFLQEPHVRFYAGVPLTTPTGLNIGTLCVIDSEKKELSKESKLVLQSLAKQVISLFELRKVSEENISLKETLEVNNYKRQEVIKNMLEGMVVQEGSGKIIEFNPAALRILGLTEGQLLGRDSMDPKWKAIHWDGTPFPGETHPAMVTLKTGRPVSNQLMGIQSGEDETRWIRINSAPIATKAGIHAVTTFQDITVYKTQEKALEAAKEKLDLALEGAGLGIWDWNLTDNSVHFDKRWVEMLGLTLEETPMNLSTWESRVHPEDLDNCYKDIQSYLEGKIDRYENTFRMKHKEGHWVTIFAKGRFSSWDEKSNPTRFTGTHLDISETKKAQEEKLAELNEILSSTPSCLKVITAKGELLEMNSQGLTLIEAESLKEVYRANVYDIVADSSRQSFVDYNQRICSGARESLVFEIVGLKGTKRWMESYAAPYRLPNGEWGHIAITNDISERIESEEEFKRQKEVAHHQSKLASIGELAAGVGHEINNPLAIVKGYTSKIERKLRANHKEAYEEASDSLTKINTSVDRIAKIVKGLRTFARADTEEIEEFNLVDSINESYQLVKEIYQSEGIEVSFLEPEGTTDLNILGSRGKFQQVLMNLLSNAKDALADRKKAKISIVAKNLKSHVKVSVKDNGGGIDLEVKDKVFDPFFTTKEVNKGTGIGLSLAYNFVSEMKGKIDFTSQSGKGTEFVLEFPIHNAKSSSKGKKTPLFSSSDPQFSGNIMLVEDELQIRELVGEMLEKMGLHVVCVENGREARALFVKNPGKFDVIITDMKMPGIDGPTLVKEIRKMKSAIQPKCIMMTGGINVDLENELKQLADGYLFKPFGEENIIEVLSRVLPLKDKNKAA